MTNNILYTSPPEAQSLREWVETMETKTFSGRRYVWVTFEQEGIHYYPLAGADPNLKSVAFLQYEHRHIFKFKVEIEVFHDDRDVEFIQFKRFCQSLMNEKDGVMTCNHKSCEMLSDELYDHISTKYPGRAVRISVSEDGENGSYTVYGENNGCTCNCGSLE